MWLCTPGSRKNRFMLHKLFSVFTFCHWVFLFGTKDSCFCVTPKKKKKELIVKVRIFFSIFPYARGQLLKKGVSMNRKEIASPFELKKSHCQLNNNPRNRACCYSYYHTVDWDFWERERRLLLLTHDGHSVIIEVHRVYFALNRDHEILLFSIYYDARPISGRLEENTR